MHIMLANEAQNEYSQILWGNEHFSKKKLNKLFSLTIGLTLELYM